MDLGWSLWVMAVPDTIMLAPAEEQALTVSGPTPPSTSISAPVVVFGVGIRYPGVERFGAAGERRARAQLGISIGASMIVS